MANVPGIVGYIQPQTISRVRTLTKAVSVPGGLRIISIQGEGRREEIIVDSAVGNGTDGFNPDFVTQSDGYGRYFRLSHYPIVENRTDLYLNGSQLRIVEDVIDSSTFSYEYDAKIDPDTGEIELQRASLVDFGGGKYYEASTSNSGDGYFSGLTLADENAPEEVWTIRCVSVLLDSYGAAIRYQATFIASGSLSGQLKDAYGQPYLWKSDCHAISNGIISFAICNPSPYAIFEKGDRFSIQVQSHVLQKQDQLSAKYIAVADLNDPETFVDPNTLFVKHGYPSVSNALSLGAQLAFYNGATSVLAIQAKPPLPRRTSDIVLPVRDTISGESGASGNSDEEDLIFSITAPGKPDIDTEVHFFVLNTDGTEQQIFPNKVNFYDPDLTDYFAAYERDPSNTLLWDNFMNPGTSGYEYSYTVVSDLKVEQSSDDGIIAPIGMGSTATFTSSNIVLSSSFVGKLIDVHNTVTANLGRFEITAVASQHSCTIIRTSGSFVTETDIRWQLLPADTVASETSQRILFTKDLALARYKGLRVTYIDQKDADFFDPNWSDVLDVLETQDVQIVVPLPVQTISAIQQAFKVHVEKMSTTYYKRERLLFTGALQGLTVANVLGTSLAAVEDIGLLEGIQGESTEDILEGNIEDLADYGVADNFGGSFRVVYFYPDEIIAVVGSERTTLPGFYMGAAGGGWFAGEANIAMPITMKTLVSFTIANNKVFKQDVLNQLGAAGITVCQPISGAVRVLHGKTTTQSGYPEEEEVSIVFIRDQLARTMRQVFQIFIGQPEDSTLLPSLTAKALGVLNQFVSQNLITAYRNLSVKRDTVEPRQWNVVVEVQPNYPVNWIFIDISVGLF
jgi:hypothetical protein